jgi:hypothetical protein
MILLVIFRLINLQKLRINVNLFKGNAGIHMLAIVCEKYSFVATVELFISVF